LASAVLAWGSVAAAAAEDPRTVKVLKVFLADFEDVPHPETYTRESFRQLFFGLGEPRQTPEGRGMAGSVREYFLDVSDGRLDVEGEVTEWLRLPGRITKVPHWKPGMEPFGESWPVIVAQTLRASGIVGPEAREKVRLADGRTPDLLVFLNTDWGTGGVNRGWGHLKEVLGKMHLADLWDEAWLGLPSPLSSYSATKWRKAPSSAADGTIDAVPPAAELEMFPLSVMMHEMGHQLAGWPDFYGPAFEPWGVFDLMGGPAVETHYPMGVSAYQRVQSGWMDFTDVPRNGRAELTLRGLAAHKVALRFRQGPGQECIVAEDRRCLMYPRDWGQPPTDKGPRLLFYRLDPAGRRRVMYGSDPCGKVTTMIRRPDPYGEVWGEEPFTTLTAATTPTSRNSLGELWWEFGDIRPCPSGEVTFEAACRATDLLAEADRAEWLAGGGKPLAVGQFGRSDGHVGLRSLASSSGVRESVLEIRAQAGGSVRGRFRAPAGGPRRLYLLARVPDGEPPARFSVTWPDAAAPVEVGLVPGVAADPAGIVVEVPTEVHDLEWTVQPAEGATAATRMWVTEAWLVGLAPVLMDLAASPPPKGWTATPEGASAVAVTGGALRLQDGFAYGPRGLSLPLRPTPDASGWRAEWPVRLPEGPAVLRGLLGLTADSPAGAEAMVTLKLVGPAREWTLMGNLELAAAGPGDGAPRREPSVVIEVPTPREMAGQEGTVVLEVKAGVGPAAAIGVPSLSLSLP